MHEDVERKFRHLEHRIKNLERWIAEIIEYIRGRRAPGAPHLTVTFHPPGALMNAVLVATLPTTRKDGSALAPTDIASITFQKTALQTDGTPGPQEILATNSAVGGAGLTDADLTLTDSAAVEGDSYTCFCTDTAGDAGDVSNAVVAPAPVPLSAPSAPSLTATFS